jgi:hypothetical protein
VSGGVATATRAVTSTAAAVALTLAGRRSGRAGTTATAATTTRAALALGALTGLGLLLGCRLGHVADRGDVADEVGDRRGPCRDLLRAGADRRLLQHLGDVAALLREHHRDDVTGGTGTRGAP